MSSDECEIDCTPPYSKPGEELAKHDSLQPKSKERFNNFEKFMKWKEEKQVKNWSQSVFLAYFSHLRQTMGPSTLWAVYSMLRCVVLNKHNVDIKNYNCLTAWLKRQSDGYKGKTSEILNSHQIQQFLDNAPDANYLAMKVVLIMGINGACRSMELANIKTTHLEYHNDIVLVKLHETKTNIDRSFVIRDEFVNFVRKYQDLRPANMKSDIFFINYKNGRCIRQNIGRHQIATMPREIAAYLKLANPELYTDHCFQRSSATLLADSRANLTTIKRHGGWKSDRVAEGYIEDSVGNKSEITSKINKKIKLSASNTTQPLTPYPSTSRHVPEPVATTCKQHTVAFSQPSTSQHEQIHGQQSPYQHPSTTDLPTSQQPSLHSDIQQTNINVPGPGKTIKISFVNCPNITNVTFNIS